VLLAIHDQLIAQFVHGFDFHDDDDCLFVGAKHSACAAFVNPSQTRMLRPRTPRKKLCISVEVVCGAPRQGEAFENLTGFVGRRSRLRKPVKRL
jgi:hypothetical protein